MNRKYLKVGAGLALAALLGAACGDDEADPTSSGQTSTTVAESGESSDSGATGEQASVETPAAELRTGLTHLLQEHVYLAGTALSTAIKDGGNLEAPATKSAVETLDENSVALSEAVASVYGEDAGDQFLQLWRDHIGFFVDYTLGGATGDAAMQTTAREKLDGYRAEFGAFIEGATEGELPADAVAEDLKTHVDTVIKVIDSALAGSPTVYPELQDAAGHMPMTAAVLAGGIAANQDLEGDVDSAASELRAGLTAQLQEHVYLAGLTLNQAVADGGNLEAPATKAAVETLDKNSVALSESIGSVYGEAGGEQFLQLWRDHIGFFVDYTIGGATGDQAMQTTAREKLDGYRTEFGAFIEGATEGGLPSDAVAEELKPHVASVITTIDSVVEGSPETFPNLRTAAGHMPHTAMVLSGAIAQQFPDMFAA